MKAVILAAGEGSRLWPISENVPKPLVKILGKYFLEYQIIELIRIGIKDVIIIKGKNFNELFEKFSHEMSEKYGVIITYMIQEDSLGTADAFLTAKNIIEEPFIGLMGDNHYQGNDIEKLINSFKKTGKQVIGGFTANNPENYGVIMTNDEKQVSMIVEKPKNPLSNLINAAIYIFKPEIFGIIETLRPHDNGETYITDAINKVIENNDLICEQIESWFDLGKPYQILPLTKFFFRNYKRFNEMSKYAEFKNGVLVAQDVVIGPNVEFYPNNGMIIIEEKTKILGSTVVIGNNYIGPECEIINTIIRETSVLIGGNVVKNGEIKNSTLGFKTKAPHFNYIGDSYIGEACNFGAGAKVANLRNDDETIKMFIEKKGQLVDTGLKKLGLFTGNNVKFGINSIAAQPGILIGSNVKIMPGEKIFRNKVSN
ncbi:MAG: sugar phosphate nucleotidyltransferase [Candidatus Nanoarchaeia archaeon]|nr:sugar phosphate nucleotidyltransferase [Candidatus Nanoarchaeia archaeon]